MIFDALYFRHNHTQYSHCKCKNVSQLVQCTFVIKVQPKQKCSDCLCTQLCFYFALVSICQQFNFFCNQISNQMSKHYVNTVYHINAQFCLQQLTMTVAGWDVNFFTYLLCRCCSNTAYCSIVQVLLVVDCISIYIHIICT